MKLKPSLNWLLAFVPVAVALEKTHAAPPLVFFAAALAIVPAAHLIVESTEHIARKTGDAIGGLLNATFGNAPELIIAAVALKAGLLDMVRASIIGAILANLLLALGASLLVNGVKNKESDFNANAARVYGSMMLLAVISLIVPSAFGNFFTAAEHRDTVHKLNTTLALMLLGSYALFLVFQIKTHQHLFMSKDKATDDAHGPGWPMPKALGFLVGASLLAAWMSEMLVGAAEGTGEALGMSSAFIGMIIVAVVGGAAETFSAIGSARKNKLDLTMGIVFGSCIQIALFVAPALVLLSNVLAPQPLDLTFGRAELGALFLAVLIGLQVSSDGKSNWFKGAQLLAVYVMMALMLYFMPDIAQ